MIRELDGNQIEVTTVSLAIAGFVLHSTTTRSLVEG
jgi:hypothetical protein